MGDSIFNKSSYRIIKNAPQALDWESYSNEIENEYKKLIEVNGNDERLFQNFFEKNLSLLPGAFGIFGESGHTPYNNVLITQPILNGLNTKIPDFLWLAIDSETIYPVFIEIETPSKKWFRKDDVPTAQLTQAQNQLSDWKNWYSNPNHQNLFHQYYDIDIEISKGKSVQPMFVLIFGSRAEFVGKNELNQKRAHLARENEVYMTFDRLTPNYKARDVITCNVKNRQYIAKYVSPTFKLGPINAKEVSQIVNKNEAIKNSNIYDERKNFLISRLSYWKEYVQKQVHGVINTNDWE